MVQEADSEKNESREERTPGYLTELEGDRPVLVIAPPGDTPLSGRMRVLPGRTTATVPVAGDEEVFWWTLVDP